MKNCKIIVDSLIYSNKSIKSELQAKQDNRKAFNPYTIGQRRLNDMDIDACLTDAEVCLIGKQSINRKKCMIGKCGTKWCVVCEGERAPKYFVAAYKIFGKKVKKIKRPLPATHKKQKHITVKIKPLITERAGEIFAMCKGTRFRKKTQIAANRKVVTDRKTGKKVWGTMAKREVCA